MNTVNLVGRLTSDPELKYTSTGKAVAKFTLAIDRYKSEADFIRIVAWDKQAEAVANYISKGQQLGITGNIKTGKYQKDDGSTVYTTEVYAQSFDFPSKPKDENKGVTNKGVTSGVDLDEFELMEDDDELPF